MKRIIYWILFQICDQFAAYYFEKLDVQWLGTDFSYVPHYKESFMKWMRIRNKFWMEGFYALSANDERD